MADTSVAPALPPEAERLAQAVVDRGLATAAVLFLSLHRPLAHLGSQALLAGSGLLAPLLGLAGFEAWHSVLADQRLFDAFTERIEELDRAARDSAPASGPAPAGGPGEEDQA